MEIIRNDERAIPYVSLSPSITELRGTIQDQRYQIFLD